MHRTCLLPAAACLCALSAVCLAQQTTASPGDFAMTISGSQVSIAAGTVSFGTHTCPGGIATGAAQFTSGSGDAWVYIDRQCQLTMLATPALKATATGSMTFQNADAPAFPVGSKQIGQLTVTNAVPVIKADLRTDFSTVPVLAGANISITPNAGSLTIETNPATVPTLGSPNVFTDANDFRQGLLLLPAGAGPPTATSCTAARVAATYIDTNVGGRGYYCKRTGETAYEWTPVGEAAVPAPVTAIPKIDWFPVGGGERTNTAEIGAGWWAPSVGGVAVVVGANFNRTYLNFTKDSDQSIVFAYMIPVSWDGGTVSVRVPWRTGGGAAAAAGQIFSLRLATFCYDNDEIFSSAPAYNGEQIPDNVTVTTPNHLMIAAIPALTMDGCGPGKFLMVQLRRDVKDTLASSAQVYGIEIGLTLKAPGVE